MPYKTSSQNPRLLEGHFDQRMEGGKLKKRWVVFHGTANEGTYQLIIYRKKNEKHTAEMQTISKSTFIGTEKGCVYSKKNGINTMYWAVILKSATVVFQECMEKRREDEEVVSIEKWYETLKAKFPMESWPVHAVRGVGAYDGAPITLTMFITKQQHIGLATTTPPKCCNQWELSTVKDCKAFNTNLFIYFKTDSDFGALSYHEVQLRMPSPAEARRAKDVIDKWKPIPEPDSPSLEVPPPTPERQHIPSPTSSRKLLNFLQDNHVEDGGPPPIPPVSSAETRPRIIIPRSSDPYYSMPDQRYTPSPTPSPTATRKLLNPMKFLPDNHVEDGSPPPIPPTGSEDIRPRISIPVSSDPYYSMPDHQYTPSPTAPRKLLNPMKFLPDNQVEDGGPPPIPARPEKTLSHSSTPYYSMPDAQQVF